MIVARMFPHQLARLRIDPCKLNMQDSIALKFWQQAPYTLRDRLLVNCRNSFTTLSTVRNFDAENVLPRLLAHTEVNGEPIDFFCSLDCHPYT